MAYLVFYLILLGGKAAFMYGSWRLAKAMGLSPWPSFVAGIFCASIVFLGLYFKARAEREYALQTHPLHQNVLAK